MQSAFKVRFGGAMGLLTVWDDAFPPGVDPSVRVILPESMNKFRYSHNQLEDVGLSKRIAFYLSRQVIMILSVHGVHDGSFLRLQRNVLKSVDRVMDIDGGRHSIRLLSRVGSSLYEGWGMKLFSRATGVHPEELFQVVLPCVSCKNLLNIMYVFRRRTTGYLSTRSQIPTEYNQWLCDNGVVGALGVLGPRESFFFSTSIYMTTGKSEVVEGPVTVGRSPCIHPGDVQPLTALDVPELRHLMDVIVFHQTASELFYQCYVVEILM